ncbi:MAG: right-handed parallel beta-helix repeat-containing protein [Verrucomicrobia bacterium]|nr:right-handed parallel beta-helix repeat-containing protein [Verrucomicrobiota bacterium]MBI3868472.1 right-handed parallel beta-helix repeat-containing protein [Verrucomicrobiota bacterium]
MSSLAAPLHAELVAISYQGRITAEPSSAASVYEMQFLVFDSSTGGDPLAAYSTNQVQVSQGVFSLALQLPSEVFSEGARWLEVRIRPEGPSAGFTVLTPRQPFARLPLAIHALLAAQADVARSIIPGVLTEDAFAPEFMSRWVAKSGPEAGVVVGPSGQLISPTNFFSANQEALQLETLSRSAIPGVYYVSMNGDDASAVVGRVDRPWRSISNAVAYAADFGSTVRVLPGTYHVNGGRLSQPYDRSRAGVTISTKTNFVLEGIGDVSLYNDSVGDIVMVENSENITIRGMRIGYEAKPSATNLYDNGPRLFGVVSIRGFNRDIIVRDLEMFNYPDHGIGTHHEGGFTTGLQVRNVMSRNSGTLFSPQYSFKGDGNVVTVYNMANVEIDNLIAEDYFRGVEVFEYDISTAGVTNMVVRNSRFLRGSHTAVYVLGSPATAQSLNDLTIENCLIDQVSNDGVTVSDFVPHGVIISGGRRVRVLNSTIRGVGIAGQPEATGPSGIMAFGDLSDLEVRGCRLASCGTGVRMFDQFSLVEGVPRNLRFVGNITSFCAGHGMLLSGVDAFVSGNCCWNNGVFNFGAGLVWQDVVFAKDRPSGTAVIEGNAAYNGVETPTQAYGLWIFSTNRLYVGQNYAWSNTVQQIRLDGKEQQAQAETAFTPFALQGAGDIATNVGTTLLRASRLVPKGSLVAGSVTKWTLQGRLQSAFVAGTARLRIVTNFGEVAADLGSLPLPSDVVDSGWEVVATFTVVGAGGYSCLVSARAEIDAGGGAVVTRLVPHGRREEVLDRTLEQVLSLEITLDAPGNELILESEYVTHQ